MIRKSALAASIAALLTPAVASALGLGNIQVTSALNEPLQARIPLRGADPGQLEELRVSLADDQQFERAGLDRVFVLTKLKFEVVEAGSGSGYINISTREPVSEPFLNFLVDVNWARGRVLREYTVLLDPPVYGAAISTGTERSVRTVDSLPPAPPPGPAMTPRAAASPAAPSMAAPSPGAPRYTGDSYGPVRQGETLWSIADRARPAGTSIQTMMLALLRANPDAFSIDNVNALRTGAVLRIPPASELTGGKAAALEEVARQHALWVEYRQSISGSVTAQPGGAPADASARAPAEGQSTGAAPSGATSTGGGETSTELKLVGAGTTGAATGGGADVEALRNELTMAQEEADAAKLENRELQSRLTEVESLVGDLQRLVELKEDQLAALQDQLARASEQAAAAPPSTMAPTETATSPAASGTAGGQAAEQTATAPKAPEPPAAAPKAPEQPPAAAKTRRAPPPPPPAPKSFMDEFNDMLPVPLWTLLAGLGAILLAFGGWRFARGRKEKAAATAATAAGVPAMANSESMIEQYASTELPDSETQDVATELPAGTSTDSETLIGDGSVDEDLVATAQTTAATPPDEEDPLAEVNVYLAYERFDQAEQLVRDAISTYPDRHDYKLKLLEVFYAAKNLAAFEAAAAVLRDAVGDDHDMMQQAREWWADLGAGRELLSDEAGPTTHTGASADEDVFDVTASDGEETGVDFDLGFESEEASGGGSSLDFDLSGDDAASTGDERDSGLDFDLGSLGGAATVAGGAAAAAAAAAASDGESGEEKPAEGSSTSAGDLDFNLDSGEDDDGQVGQGTGLDFDLSADDGLDTPVSPDAVTQRASVPERAGTSDADTGVDFDLGGFDEDTGSEASATGGTGDDSLDFDLGDTAGTVEGGRGPGAGTLHDEAGEESGLDFDLGDTQNVDRAARDAAGDAALDPDGELDFDLGDTLASTSAKGDEDSVLDFDLGDTGPATDAGSASTAGEDESLDFDLGDTHQTVSRAGEAGADDTGSGAELDFDLSDTASMEAGTSSADQGEELDFDLGDTASDVRTGAGDAAEDLGLDLDLGAGTDDGAGSVPELDLSLEAGDDDAADGVPLIDIDGDEEESPSFDTVKLDAETADSIRDDASAGTDSEFGVDTEFRGIFAADDEGDGSSAGSDSVLDFDLGSADLGAGAEEDSGSTGFSELESTQFMLNDIGGDDGVEDEDDHTLALGRGASGEVDENQTKLDLAQAYMDMGDTEGARNLLGEVMADGDDPQKEQAGEMLKKLS